MTTDSKNTMDVSSDSVLSIAFRDPERAAPLPLTFQWLPAGAFRMGQRGGGADEEPVHRVTVAESFYLGTFPVTQAQYRAMAAACLADLQVIEGNRGISPAYFSDDDRPVEQVSVGPFCRKGLSPQGKPG